MRKDLQERVRRYPASSPWAGRVVPFSRAQALGWADTAIRSGDQLSQVLGGVIIQLIAERDEVRVIEDVLRREAT